MRVDHETGQTGRPLTRSARHQRSPEAWMRRSFGLTLLGAVLPGAGLTRTRYAKAGWTILLLVVVSLIGLVGVILVQGPYAAALAVGVRPKALFAVAAFLVVAGLVWVWTLVLTHRGTQHPSLRPRQRIVLQVWTALLCLAVAAPLAVGAQYSLIQRSLVGTVFTGGQDPIDGLTRAEPTLGVTDPWAGVGRITMLLLGSDAGDDRVGIRTDSMILANIDTKTGETLLFSLPRNLQNVPFPKDNPLRKIYPNGYTCGNECLLNAVWTEAEAHKDLFPSSVRSPGLYTLQGVITEITGLRIDNTAIIDLKGFESLVDAMGGVTVNVTERLPIQGWVNSQKVLVGVEEWLEPGVQHLDGYHALWFARSRLASDDWSRMRRQRCLVGKIIGQVNPASMLQKYPALAQVARDNITTDIRIEHLPAWVTLIERVKGASIRSLTFTHLNINPGDPDFASIKKMVQTAVDPNATPTPTSSRTPTRTSSTPTRSTATTTRTVGPSSTRSTPSTPTQPTEDTLVSINDAC